MAKDTEQIILETARKQFVKNGYAGTRMQEISEESGINKALLHYYFRSKEKLYQEVVVKTLDFVLPKFMGAMDSQGDIWARLENLLDVYFDILIKNPDIPMFMMSEISQRRESLVEELKRRAGYFPAVRNFMIFLNNEVREGRIKSYPPLQLMLSIL